MIKFYERMIISTIISAIFFLVSFLTKDWSFVIGGSIGSYGYSIVAHFLQKLYGYKY